MELKEWSHVDLKVAAEIYLLCCVFFVFRWPRSKPKEGVLESGVMSTRHEVVGVHQTTWLPSTHISIIQGFEL